MDEVRIGVAGIGGMGSNHCGYLTKGSGVAGARLAAVADVEPERLALAQTGLGDGVIRNVSGSRSEPRLTIEFGGMRRKTLFARYASLEIIES